MGGGLFDPLRFIFTGRNCPVAFLGAGHKGDLLMNNVVTAFQRMLVEVQMTEKTNTRSAYTDWQCRQFFVEHGQALLELLLKGQENGRTS